MATYQKIVEQNKQTVNANSVTTDNAAGRLMTESPPSREKGDEPKPTIQNETKPKETMNNPNASDKQEAKPPEKTQETGEQKKPKAIMPKQEKN
jgi:hypothetical protein